MHAYFQLHNSSCFIKYFLSLPFIEAVPSVVILFYLSMIETKGTGVIVEDNDDLKFEIKLYISLITASIGLSKSLKHSVCRIMGNDGHFDGFFTGKYFIIFLACLTGFKWFRVVVKLKA